MWNVQQRTNSFVVCHYHGLEVRTLLDAPKAELLAAYLRANIEQSPWLVERGDYVRFANRVHRAVVACYAEQGWAGTPWGDWSLWLEFGAN